MGPGPRRVRWGTRQPVNRGHTGREGLSRGHMLAMVKKVAQTGVRASPALPEPEWGLHAGSKGTGERPQRARTQAGRSPSPEALHRSPGRH